MKLKIWKAKREKAKVKNQTPGNVQRKGEAKENPAKI